MSIQRIYLKICFVKYYSVKHFGNFGKSKSKVIIVIISFVLRSLSDFSYKIIYYWLNLKTFFIRIFKYNFLPQLLDSFYPSFVT